MRIAASIIGSGSAYRLIEISGARFGCALGATLAGSRLVLGAENGLLLGQAALACRLLLPHLLVDALLSEVLLLVVELYVLPVHAPRPCGSRMLELLRLLPSSLHGNALLLPDALFLHARLLVLDRLRLLSALLMQAWLRLLASMLLPDRLLLRLTLLVLAARSLSLLMIVALLRACDVSCGTLLSHGALLSTLLAGSLLGLELLRVFLGGLTSPRRLQSRGLLFCRHLAIGLLRLELARMLLSLLPAPRGFALLHGLQARVVFGKLSRARRGVLPSLLSLKAVLLRSARLPVYPLALLHLLFLLREVRELGAPWLILQLLLPALATLPLRALGFLAPFLLLASSMLAGLFTSPLSRIE